MGLDIKAPENVILKPKIIVFGVGGAGGNAINNMIKANLKGANFVVANTDAQALEHSASTNKIQLGAALTKGLGAGAAPDVGRDSAIESEKEIISYLEGSNMVFVTAGMGGGTGTGASPIIAKLAKELGILTVGVVTKPFLFEGSKRMKAAEKGLQELQQHVDTLIIIPNQNLFRIANENTTFQEAFAMADEVLHAGVRGVTDLITSPGLVNLDFADIETVMSEKGKAMMGTGEASGEERAIRAAELAIANPLLDQGSMHGASGVLINITGGKDMTLYEVDSAANRIREEAGDHDANIIFGSTFNPELEGTIRVSVVATGIGQEARVAAFVKDEVIASLGDHKIEELESLDSDVVNSESLEEYELPLYNGYEYDEQGDGSEDGVYIKPNTILREEEDEFASVKVAKQPEAASQNNQPKHSFLRRMWNSLKMSEEQEEQSLRQQPNVIAGSDSSSDVREMPEFFRKDR